MKYPRQARSRHLQPLRKCSLGWVDRWSRRAYQILFKGTLGYVRISYFFRQFGEFVWHSALDLPRSCDGESSNGNTYGITVQHAESARCLFDWGLLYFLVPNVGVLYCCFSDFFVVHRYDAVEMLLRIFCSVRINPAAAPLFICFASSISSFIQITTFEKCCIVKL